MLRFVGHQFATGLWAAMPAMAVATFGLAALGWLMLTTPAAPAPFANTQVGIVIAPWSQTGLTTAAQFDLPIIDLRWGGHLVILDVSRSAGARARLRDLGYLFINTSAFSGCLNRLNLNAEPI